LARYADNLQAGVEPSEAPRGPFGRPCLLCDYVHFELGVSEDQGRIVVRNEHFVALVPWWAVWPFELLGEQKLRDWLLLWPTLLL
jgi:UDPglucose--hexose-1-phosphate uridylyltransferase